MATLPNTRQKRLEWFEARADLWTEAGAEIGLSEEMTTSLQARVQTDRANFNAAQVARNAAKAATNTWYDSNNDLVGLGRELVKTIKAFADATQDPGVYSKANIDPPAPPTPVPAPSIPGDFTGSVDPTGVVTLTWTATPSGASSGVFFMVERSRNGGAFTVIGASVEKSFVDTAAEVASGPVSYRVRAVRGDKTSAFTTPVNFNFTMGGGFTVSTGEELKMAA